MGKLREKRGRLLLQRIREAVKTGILVLSLLLVGAACIGGVIPGSAGEVLASESIVSTDSVDAEGLPSGIAAVISSITGTPGPGSRVNRLGTTCEHVMVGQRVTTVTETEHINVSHLMMNKVNDLKDISVELAMSPAMMSDEDYDTLLRIVEAEAGEDDVKGRVLVANVIMNRVAREDFPNTVTDVVFQYVNGVPQFSPVYYGTIYDVTVTDETREAVKQALQGVDYSQGALFFIQKSAAEKNSVNWFEKELKKLFKHGVHEFYTYPEDIDMQKTEDAETAKAGEVSDQAV